MKLYTQYLVLLLVMATGILSCQQTTSNDAALLARIDSLEKKLSKSYKPGFGEFMSSIQVHHAKLWFAGQAENWKLADFEVHEIMESLDDLRVFQTERKESKMISMLDMPLDSVNKAIEQENLPRFNKAFVLLTNTCNHCHAANAFEFNLVKIPDRTPFDNQDFGSRIKRIK